MAEIISFADHRKPEKPTFLQVAVRCQDEIATNWEKFAKGNQLNDFFVSSVPSWTKEGVNYLSDLNALSQIENKIKLLVQISAPGTLDKQQLGWVAAFTINDTKIETPFMFSEAYARCFNILLFLKLGRELTQNGISIN